MEKFFSNIQRAFEYDLSVSLMLSFVALGILSFAMIVLSMVFYPWQTVAVIFALAIARVIKAGLKGK